MASNGLGQSEFTVRSTTGVERMGGATDRHQQRNPRQERRDRNPPNPQRRRVYDMLFDEVDHVDGMDDRQRARLKANLRDHLTTHAPPRSSSPPPEHDEEALANGLLNDPTARIPVDHDHIVQAATKTGKTTTEDAENALLAQQLRDCLARHTDRARKIAVYLHLLLTIDGALRPHTIVDV